MIRKLTLVFAALFLYGFSATAQKCGFDPLHQKLLQSDPAYNQRIIDDNARYADAMRFTNSSLVNIVGTDTTYEIPIVIHVMHTGGAIGSIYNPSTAQLIGMIDYLNQAYAATYASYPNTTNGGTNVPIRFVLAKRTPDCSATNGIIRYNLDTNAAYVAHGVNSDSTNGLSDAVLKDHQRWPVNEYYNVYIVNKIDSKDGTVGVHTAGFAYFANAGYRVDGTVMLAHSAMAGAETLPHEIGHAMNLYHVFEGNDPTGNGSNVCPTESNCFTQNDLVCDTEPMKQSVFNCPSGNNPCTNLPWLNTQHNFMDYSNCKDRFTPGQRVRMIDALKQYRSGLISSLGGTALPALAITPAACIPTTTNTGNMFNVGPRKVVLNDMTGASRGGYTADGNLAYQDFSCQQQANLNAGQTYTITVTTGNNERLSVFIDYNNDGIFSAAEQVVSRQGSGAQTANFTVPATGVVSCLPLRMRVASDIGVTNPTACGPYNSGQAEDYSVSVTGPSNTASVALALTAGSNPSCINDQLTFTATPGGTPGTGVTYKFYINGTAVTAATSSTTYTTTTPVNGNVVTARIFYTGPCGADSSLSNTFLVQRNTAISPAINIALTAGSNPGCIGQTLTFTATATNGGSNPSYSWRKNGTAIPGAGNSNVYSSNALANGDVISAVLTSSLTCAVPSTATSNPITIIFSNSIVAMVSINQTVGSNPTCSGKPVTFQLTATNPGAAPLYAWLVNGYSTGDSATTFTTRTLRNNDTVRAILISSSQCVNQPAVLSNPIVMRVITSDTPRVTLKLVMGTNPSCSDSLLKFRAQSLLPTFGGYIWYVNGLVVSTDSVFSSTGFANGDKVYVALNAGPGCHVNDTVYSDTITVLRYSTPTTPVISFIGNTLTANGGNIQWFGPYGLIAGATGNTYHATVAGNYYARNMANGCYSLPSNILHVSLLTIGSLNMDAVQIYPNPTTGKLVIDWGTMKASMQINLFNTTGQKVMQQNVVNATRELMDLSSLSNGIYFVMIRNEAGETGTVRITVTK